MGHGGHIGVAGGKAYGGDWRGAGNPSANANPTADELTIVGAFQARGIALHPAATVAAVVSWRSFVAAALRIGGEIRGINKGCCHSEIAFAPAAPGTARTRIGLGERKCVG